MGSLHYSLHVKASFSSTIWIYVRVLAWQESYPSAVRAHQIRVASNFSIAHKESLVLWQQVGQMTFEGRKLYRVLFTVGGIWENTQGQQQTDTPLGAHQWVSVMSKKHYIQPNSEIKNKMCLLLIDDDSEEAATPHCASLSVLVRLKNTRILWKMWFFSITCIHYTSIALTMNSSLFYCVFVFIEIIFLA